MLSTPKQAFSASTLEETLGVLPVFSRSCLLAPAGACGLAAAALAQPQFVNLPAPADISDDGSIVVGTTSAGTYRWVRGPGGATSLTVLPLSLGGTVRCSTDGSVVSSQMPSNNIDMGVENASVTGRWTSATGFAPFNDYTTFFGLGTPFPPGTITTFRNTSRDGRFAVGFGYVSSGIGGYRPRIIDTLSGTATRPSGTRALTPPARPVTVMLWPR